MKDYYIQRSLQRQRIKAQVLKEENGLFFITGANKEDLTKLEAKEGDIHIWKDGQTYKNGIILPASDQSDQEIFQKLAENRSRENVHWLEYQKGYLFWRAFSKDRLSEEFIYKNYDSDEKNILKEEDYSYSEDLGQEVVTSVAQFIDENYDSDEENILKEEDFTNPVDLWQKVVILANDSGVGKSTVLTSIAQEMKRKYPALWVVRVNLNDHAEKGQESSLEKIDPNWGDTRTSDKVIDFVSKMAVPGDSNNPDIHLQRKLFKAGLEKLENTDGQNLKIVILFDGFDEISPNYKPNTIKLIKALKGSKATQLWVTTRVHEKTDLEKELVSPAYILNDLTEEQQIMFLDKFWRWSLKFSKEEDSKKAYKKIREHLGEIKSSLESLFNTITVTNNGGCLTTIEGPFYPFLNQRISENLWKYSSQQEASSEQLESLRGAVDELDFSDYVVLLLDKWKDSIRDTEKAFTKVPVNLKMLADIVFENKFQPPENLGLFYLYKKFIKVKFDIYYQEKAKTIQGN